jgi:hypothetical protein
MDRTQVLFATAFIVIGCAGNCNGQTLYGDYNGDAIVSHADYSVLGDNWGRNVALMNDATIAIPVGPPQFEQYITNYGCVFGDLCTESTPRVLRGAGPPVAPFAITPSSTIHGDTVWFLVFHNASGALSAHVNISSRFANDPSRGPQILSVAGGPSFRDNNIPIAGVPGFIAPSIVANGIVERGFSEAFAALGTTLGDHRRIFIFSLWLRTGPSGQY